MAKTYRFTIHAVPAEFNEGDGYTSIKMSMSLCDDGLWREQFEGTLAQVVARRQALSDAEQRPHAAFIHIDRREPRKPAGYDAATKVLYAKRTQQEAA